MTVPSSWCERHFTRFRMLLDLKGPAVGDALLEEMMSDPRVMAHCGANFLTGAKADEEKLLSALKVFSPVCCHLGDETMERLYQQLAFGRGQAHRPILELLQ